MITSDSGHHRMTTEALLPRFKFELVLSIKASRGHPRQPRQAGKNLHAPQESSRKDVP